MADLMRLLELLERDGVVEEAQGRVATVHYPGPVREGIVSYGGESVWASLREPERKVPVSKSYSNDGAMRPAPRRMPVGPNLAPGRPVVLYHHSNSAPISCVRPYIGLADYYRVKGRSQESYIKLLVMLPRPEAVHIRHVGKSGQTVELSASRYVDIAQLGTEADLERCSRRPPRQGRPGQCKSSGG